MLLVEIKEQAMPILKKAKAEAGPTAEETYAFEIENNANLQGDLGAITKEELAWTAPKEDAEVVQLISARRAAAEALASGSPSTKGARKRTFRDIINDRRDIELAIQISNERCERARLAAAGERYTARIGDVAKVGKRMAEAFFELEAAMRERDALTREIGLPAGSLWLEAWPVGRIANTGSLPHRFLEAAVSNGAITQRELDEAVSAARAAQR
jgi:hypothetical protein